MVAYLILLRSQWNSFRIAAMHIISMVFCKLRKTWEHEDQHSVLLSRDFWIKLMSLRTRDILKKLSSMLKLITIKNTYKWELKQRKMLRTTTKKFGKNRSLRESKKTENGNSKICMLQLVAHWILFKWRMDQAEEVREMSSIQILIQTDKLICIHSRSRMRTELKTSMPTNKWINLSLEMRYWIKSSTMIWRGRSTKSKNLDLVIKWTWAPKNPWWVKTCSTAWRERRRWSWWDHTGKQTSKTKSTSKKLALFLSETCYEWSIKS